MNSKLRYRFRYHKDIYGIVGYSCCVYLRTTGNNSSGVQEITNLINSENN